MSSLSSTRNLNRSKIILTPRFAKTPNILWDKLNLSHEDIGKILCRLLKDLLVQQKTNCLSR
jgi:hypothetical protein